MKYWLLTTEYPPFYGGGIGTYSYFTAQMFSQKGDAVSVFVPDNGVEDYRIEPAQNVTIIRFNTNRSKLNNTLGYTARLSYEFAVIVKEQIAINGKPDCIEAQDYLGIAYYLQQFKLTGYAGVQNIPIVITLHSPAFLYLEYNRVAVYKFPEYWTGEMEKQAIIAADALISPTYFLQEHLRNYMDFSKSSVHIIPNPYSNDTTVNYSGFQRNKILFYGKLSPQKGVFQLLEYFKEIWDEGHTYCLELIGGTDIVYHPELQTMGQLINNQYRTYIKTGLLKITGKIPPSAITETLKNAHVIIIPSIIDNLPYAVIEAMSRERVVLSSVQGGQKEIIQHEQDGFLFDHKIEGDFKKQLFKILALSDAEIITCGKRAAEKIQTHYNFEKIYSQKIRLLRQLCMKTEVKNNFPFLYQESFLPLQEEANNLLSVVIPYYNMGSYIQECINSVLQSAYTPLEIIIVNDGSTDKKSLLLLQELSQLKNITVYNNKNRGLAESRNFGAQKAKGRFLAFLDADDEVTTGYYEKAIHVLNCYENVFFVGAWVQYFENSTAVWPAFTPQPPYALIHNPVNSSGLVYKKAAFLSAGKNDKAVDYGLEDYESIIALLHNGYNGVVLPDRLFYYRVRSGSMIRNINKNKLIYSYKYITEKHRAYFAKFAPQIINLLNANGPGYSFDNPTIEQRSMLNKKIISPFFERIKHFVAANPRLKNLVLKLARRKGL